MKQLGAVVVLEAGALALFDDEAELVMRPTEVPRWVVRDLLWLACWFWRTSQPGGCAAPCVSEPAASELADSVWPREEPVEFYVTTDPVRLARAARTAARRAGGAR
jgi:hypothetical protein